MCLRELAEAHALYADINEVYLFHGTKNGSVEVICRQGIDTRVGTNRGKMFGQGSYFAENASKSDQYCVNDTWSEGCARRTADSELASQADSNARFRLFVARVCLGEPFTSSSNHRLSKLKKPPAKLSSGDEYDSLLYKPAPRSDGTPRHREFVVYDHNSCYPEFVIEYSRPTPPTFVTLA